MGFPFRDKQSLNYIQKSQNPHFLRNWGTKLDFGIKAKMPHILLSEIKNLENDATNTWNVEDWERRLW